MSNPSGFNQKASVNGTELRLDQALEGVDTSFPPSVQQIVVGGVAYTQPDLKKKVESVRAPWKNARAAHASLRQFSLDKPRLEDEASQFLAELNAAMVAQYGPSSETLTAFGFKPQKRRRQLTVEEKAIKAAKARLTREKRGTMGKRQKAEIVTKETPDVHIGADGHMTIEQPKVGPQPTGGGGPQPPA